MQKFVTPTAPTASDFYILDLHIEFEALLSLLILLSTSSVS